MFEFRQELVDGGQPPDSSPFTVLSVDDDPGFQQSLRMALSDFRFNESPLRLLTASSSSEARDVMAANPGISAILLDVVMETDDAGLQLVRAVREQLGNSEVRIVLITGQPGMAPLRKTLQQLDISEYWLKTDLYRERLQGIVTGSLRTWSEIHALARAKRGLKHIVQAGSRLAGLRDPDDFSRQLLCELAALLEVPLDGLVCVHDGSVDLPVSEAMVTAADGGFATLQGCRVQDIADPMVRDLLLDAFTRRCSIGMPSSQVLYLDGGGTVAPMAIYLATERSLDAEEHELLQVFVTHANAGLVNVDLAARLERVAYRDSLLDIPNGNALRRDLRQVLEQPGRCGQSLLVVDLGQYSDGSLALGPEQGDLLLQAWPTAWHRCIRRRAASRGCTKAPSRYWGRPRTWPPIPSMRWNRARTPVSCRSCGSMRHGWIWTSTAAARAARWPPACCWSPGSVPMAGTAWPNTRSRASRRTCAVSWSRARSTGRCARTASASRCRHRWISRPGPSSAPRRWPAGPRTDARNRRPASFR